MRRAPRWRDGSHPGTKERRRSTTRWNCWPIERKSHRLGLQNGQSLCAQSICGQLCALRLASLQETAETVSRALAYLTDRLSWPYCLQVTADQCLELYEKIERAHVVYQRYAKRHAANFMLSVLHD